MARKFVVEDRHKVACHYRIAKMTQAEIGKQMGVTRQTVMAWLKQPEVQTYLEDVSKKIDLSIEQGVVQAYTMVWSELMKLVTDAKSEGTKVKAIELFYKLGGKFKSAQEVNVNVKHTHQILSDWLKSDDGRDLDTVLNGNRKRIPAPIDVD